MRLDGDFESATVWCGWWQRVDGLFDSLRNRADADLHHFVKDLLFGGEVIVDAAGIDPRAFGNPSQRGRRIALVSEQDRGGVQYSLAGGFGFADPVALLADAAAFCISSNTVIS